MAAQSLIGNLAVNLFMETAAFEKGATHAERQVAKLAKKFEKIGQGWVDLGQKLSIGVTAPLVAMATASVRGAQQQAEAMGQVNAALKSMGDGAGRTSEQLLRMSDEMELRSLFDGDEILRKLTANMLTFGNVAGENFDRAQQAALDLSTRMGTDLQSSALLVGKALNDPVKGLTALRRTGIQFTEQQQDQVKAMAAVGDTAGAQSVMLAELERQFGGAAQAAANTSPWREAQVRLGQVGDTIGEILLPYIAKAAKALESLLNRFQQLSPGAQQAIVAVGALVAVVGPLMIVAGLAVQAMAPFIGVLKLLAASGGVLAAAKAGLVGLAAAFGPVLISAAAIAAAGYLIYQNWDKIAPVLEEFWQSLQKAIGPEVGDLIRQVSGLLQDLWSWIGPPAKMAVEAFGMLYAAWVRTFGPIVLGAVKAAISLLGGFIKAVRDVSGFAVSAIKSLYEGVYSWFGQKLNALWELGIRNIEKVKKAFFWLYDAVVGNSYIPDMVDGIAAQMNRLDAVMVDPARKATKKAADAFKALAEQVSPILDRLFPEAAAANRFRADRDTIDRAVAGGALTAEQGAEAQRRLALEGREGGLQNFLAGTDQPLGVIADLDGALIKLTDRTKATASGVQAANVRIVESFKDMATNALDSLTRLGNSIKSGGFLDIFSSVFDLLLNLGSLGVFGKGISTRINSAGTSGFGGFRANGGPVVPGKTYIVGENGPEWFSPGSAAGRISPMNDNGGGARVTIVPGPYFDAVVEGRAAKVAAPMAAAAGHFARGAAGADAVRARRRRIPG